MTKHPALIDHELTEAEDDLLRGIIDGSLRPLRIADPAEMAEAYGVELYPMSFNDGFDFAWAGHRVEKPFWWCYREAKRMGHRWPRDYAHGFCQGYREALGQIAHPPEPLTEAEMAALEQLEKPSTHQESES